MIVETYVTYLVVSIALTVWVARTLSRNGRIFLVHAFDGNEALADSINHMLVVGFYLLNLGYVTLALRFGDHPQTMAHAIEVLSTKIGVVLLILGCAHFALMGIITRWGKTAAQEWQALQARNEPAA